MDSPTMDPSSHNLSPERKARIREGLRWLLEAHVDAEELGRKGVDVALDARELHEAGLHTHDLCWLVLARHIEVTPTPVQPEESRLLFTQESRFFLTPSGVTLARQICESAALRKPPVPSVRGPDHKRPRPHWKNKTGELSVGGILVKRIEQSASNIRTILDVFQEEHWRECIDDPLWPRHGIDSHQRLYDAVRRLNLCQINRLLLFHVVNKGTAIRWQPLVPSNKRAKNSLRPASAQRAPRKRPGSAH